MTTAQARDPLPAREVERPLVVPVGWSLVELGAGRDELSSIGRRGSASAGLRAGVLPRVELFGVGSLVWLDGEVGPADPTVGARLSLLRAEPPARSVALTLRGVAPYGAAPGGVPLGVGVPELGASLAGRLAAEGLRATAELGGRWRLAGPVGWSRDARGGAAIVDPGERLEGRVELGVQPGPLFLAVAGGGALRGPTTTSAGGRSRELGDAGLTGALGARARAQLSRAVAVELSGRWATGAEPLLPDATAGSGLALGLELAP